MLQEYLEALLKVLLKLLVDLAAVVLSLAKYVIRGCRARVTVYDSVQIYLNQSALWWDSLVVLRVEDHAQLHLEVLLEDPEEEVHVGVLTEEGGL